jgi:hypothetical protein
LIAAKAEQQSEAGQQHDYAGKPIHTIREIFNIPIARSIVRNNRPNDCDP